MNQKIDFNDIPKNYLYCTHNKCPRRNECQLAASYLEYVDAEIDGDIIKETEKETAAALETLINGVNEKIEEIYRYAKIEIHAQARALESMMSQEGYVDPNFKIR